MGMRLAVVAALLLLALTACSSGGDGAPTYQSCVDVSKAGAAPLHKGDPGYSAKLDRDGDGTACDGPTKAASTSASSASPASAVSAQTITACRALADDKGLADYWSKVANGGMDARSAVEAANAIRGLEAYLPMQDVD